MLLDHFWAGVISASVDHCRFKPPSLLPSTNRHSVILIPGLILNVATGWPRIRLKLIQVQRQLEATGGTYQLRALIIAHFLRLIFSRSHETTKQRQLLVLGVLLRPQLPDRFESYLPCGVNSVTRHCQTKTASRRAQVSVVASMRSAMMYPFDAWLLRMTRRAVATVSVW